MLCYFSDNDLIHSMFIFQKLSLSLIGGRDLNDTTRKVASLLVCHELSLKLNLTGANEKHSLNKLDSVVKLIFGRITFLFFNIFFLLKALRNFKTSFANVPFYENTFFYLFIFIDVDSNL